MSAITVIRDRAAKIYSQQFKSGREWENGLMSYARKDFIMGWDARDALAANEGGGLMVITPQLRRHLLKLVEIAESELEGHDWTENIEDCERYGQAVDEVRTAFRLSDEPAQEG